jgi:hypothetical protein
MKKFKAWIEIALSIGTIPFFFVFPLFYRFIGGKTSQQITP